MFNLVLRKRRVTHPAPDVLLPFVLGETDAATAAHIAGCASCQSEVESLRESTELLRSSTLLDHRGETPDCPDELILADFVEGRLSPADHPSLVAHLLACARCRATVRATADLAGRGVSADVAGKPRRGWAFPVGVAAAAVVLWVLLPSRFSERSAPIFREPPLTNSTVPLPILPRGSIGYMDHIVWSSVPHAGRYRVRLYDAQGNVLWQDDIKDTVAAPPRALILRPGDYFWRVAAETEFRRWAASDLVPFRITEPAR